MHMAVSHLQISVRRLMITVAALAVGLVLAESSQKTYFSCHLCHNRKFIETRSVLGLAVQQSEKDETEFASDPGHQHQWSRYSRQTWNLIGGGGVACRVSVYLDGSAAPDGLR
jgi:hypothetical protein